MLQEQSRPVNAHKLIMQNRQKVDLTGITEVISFDNKVIELETLEGAVRFAGEGLHVKRLTLEKGEVELEGHIQEIVYHESQKAKTAGGMLSRLFR